MAITTPLLGTPTAFAAAATSAVPMPGGGGDLRGYFLILVLGANVPFSTTQTTSLGGTWIDDLRTSGTAGTATPQIYATHRFGVSGEPSTITVTHGIVGTWAQILAFPGVDQTNPLDVAVSTVDQSAGGTANCVIPGVTLLTNGCALVTFADSNTITQTATPPVGFTESGDSGATMSGETSYLLNVAAGATGNKTVVFSGAGKQYGIMYALRPAPDLKSPQQMGMLQPGSNRYDDYTTEYKQRKIFDLAFLASVPDIPTGIPAWMVQAAAVIRPPVQPQQRRLVSEPAMLNTALLENELLGDTEVRTNRASTVYQDRREVPQQRAYVSDPLLLGTALLENELLGGADVVRHRQAAYYDRRLVPQQPKRDAYTPGLLDTGLLEVPNGYSTYSPALQPAASQASRRLVPQQPKRDGYTPGLLDSALLEVPNGYSALHPALAVAATQVSRRLVPFQPLRSGFTPGLLDTAQFEIPFGYTAEHAALQPLSGQIFRVPWLRIPQVKADASSPAPIQWDPTQSGLPNWLFYGAYATEVPRVWQPQQRRYISDPSLLSTAELENELLGFAVDQNLMVSVYLNRRVYPYQPLRQGFTPGLLDSALFEVPVGTFQANPETAIAATHQRLPWFRFPEVQNNQASAQPDVWDPTLSGMHGAYLLQNQEEWQQDRGRMPAYQTRDQVWLLLPPGVFTDPILSGYATDRLRRTEPATHAQRQPWPLPVRKIYAYFPPSLRPVFIGWGIPLR